MRDAINITSNLMLMAYMFGGDVKNRKTFERRGAVFGLDESVYRIMFIGRWFDARMTKFCDIINRSGPEAHDISYIHSAIQRRDTDFYTTPTYGVGEATVLGNPEWLL